MCSSGSFGRAVCASIRTVELSTSEHDYYYDIRYNSMVSLNYSLSIPEGRVPSAVRNRHCEQHPPHAAEGHRRCVPPVPHADRVHPERVRPEDGRLERAGLDRKSTPSELQSPMYLVCRLLLEKKKT